MRKTLVCTGMGLALLVLSASSCNLHNAHEPTEVEALMYKMQGKYQRHIHVNHYSLDYSYEEPNVLYVNVQYKPQANLRVVRTVAAQARGKARSIARDDLKFTNLVIRTRMRRLE